MKEDNPKKPKTKPAGNRPPPRPPTGVAVGLGPEGDEPGKNRRTIITKAADGEGKFIRQVGGIGNHGHVILRIEPNGRGKGNIIISEIPEGTIAIEYIKPVMEAIRLVLDYGVLEEGGPLVDVVVRIVGGSTDKAASNDLAFRMAGIFAIKDAVKKAGPAMIE